MARRPDISDRVVLLLALVPYLREHGPTPVARLAREFDVDADLLRGLVAFLGTAGVPGETHTYQPEDLFDIDWDAFEERDLVSLTNIVAVDDTPRFAPAEHAALLAGLHALGGMLPESERGIAEQAAAKLALAAPSSAQALPGAEPPTARPSISVSAEPADPGLATLFAALARGARLSFEYRDLRGTLTSRTVEPLGLAQSTGGWYLRAHCLDREAERTFLVDAIRDPRLLDEPSERRGDPAAAPALGPEHAEVTAVLRVRESSLHRISGFSPRPVGPAEEGWLRAEVRLAHPAAAIRLVQASPGDIVVEEPPAARAAVHEWASRALAPYDT